MDIKTNKSLPRIERIDIDPMPMLHQIATGKAVLFAGAGFSIGTKNLNGNTPPLASMLAEKICQLGGFPEDKDLQYAADFFISNSHNKDELISLLKREYTISSTTDIHNNICSVGWKRFYTTNYDKAIEIASQNSGKMVECIDIKYPASEYYKREGLCIHLNGSIDSLTTDSLENDFKLSASSYISSDAFLSSDWYYRFKTDLERSAAIVFVGYSMSDIDIQKILFKNAPFTGKTYFIIEENSSPKLVFTLSKFGQVLQIGIDKLSRLIVENKEIFEHKQDQHNYQSLCKYNLAEESRGIRDSDVERFLMYGNIDDAYIDDGVSSNQRIPYLILRDELEKVSNFVGSGQNSILYSGLGNGKTALLRMITTHLTLKSIDVFEVKDLDADYISDFDALAKTSKQTVIIIDGYEPYFDLIKHYSLCLPSNINIIATARTAEHERLRPKLTKIGFHFNELSVDELSEGDAITFVEIIDNVGMWGDRAGLSHKKKIAFLSHKNSMQLSLSLLSLINAPQMKSRISSLLLRLLRNSKYKSTIFAIAFLEVLDIRPSFSLISDVAGNNDIYSSLLLNNEDFKHLFTLSGQQTITKSSLFCLFLIKNNFSAAYIIKQFEGIADKFNSYNKKDYLQDRIFKATLKFSFIERLLPDANKKGNLKLYYENLKVCVPWLKQNPHYWLQHAMAHITFQEYSRAKDSITQAYALAKTKYNYHTSNIDTQHARLLILMAIAETDHLKLYPMFEEAHRLLSNLDDDDRVYKYRQVILYEKFYSSCFNQLSKKNKANFLSSCKRILNDIAFIEAREPIYTPVNYNIKKVKKDLQIIIDRI